MPELSQDGGAWGSVFGWACLQTPPCELCNVMRKALEEFLGAENAGSSLDCLKESAGKWLRGTRRRLCAHSWEGCRELIYESVWTLQTPWRAPQQAWEHVEKERALQKGEKLDPA